jgi:hypothetical protein
MPWTGGRHRRCGQPGSERREAQLAEGRNAAVGGLVSGFQQTPPAPQRGHRPRQAAASATSPPTHSIAKALFETLRTEQPWPWPLGGSTPRCKQPFDQAGGQACRPEHSRHRWPVPPVPDQQKGRRAALHLSAHRQRTPPPRLREARNQLPRRSHPDRRGPRQVGSARRPAAAGLRADTQMTPECGERD